MGTSLALPLGVSGVAANNAHDAFAPDDAALVAAYFNGSFDFHFF
jgi:hypothetical protein